jgi:hypothetical protein
MSQTDNETTKEQNLKESLEKSTTELSLLCKELGNILAIFKEKNLKDDDTLKQGSNELSNEISKSSNNSSNESSNDSSNESSNESSNDSSNESSNESSNIDSENFEDSEYSHEWNSFQKLLDSQLKLTSIFMDLIRK